MHIGKHGFRVMACGCRVRGKRICKHYYANQRSASTESASGTGSGDGGIPKVNDPEVVQPGIPQPAPITRPTFFSDPMNGRPWKLVFPRARGVDWWHTREMARDYRYHLRLYRRAKRRRNT